MEQLSRIMPNRTETIKTRVSPKEKEMIEEYLEKSGEFDSKSRLIRILLHRHITNNKQDVEIDTDEIKSVIDNSVGDLQTELNEISERIADIGVGDLQTELNEISERIADIEHKVRNSEDISELANDIYNQMLVLDDSIDEEFETIQDFEKLASTPEEEAAFTGSAKAFADLNGVNENTTRRALSRANDMFPDVKFVTERNGMRRYYRDER